MVLLDKLLGLLFLKFNMIEQVPFQIFSLSLGMISFLAIVIFRDFNSQLKDIKREQLSCPFPAIKADIAAMKADINWLKEYLIKTI
jgi:hypothetical protein